VCGWQVKLCDLLVTRGPYLSALEMHHDKALYKFTFTLSYEGEVLRTNAGTVAASRAGIHDHKGTAQSPRKEHNVSVPGTSHSCSSLYLHNNTHCFWPRYV